MTVVKTTLYAENFSVSADESMKDNFHIERLSHLPGTSVFVVTIFMAELGTTQIYEVDNDDIRLVWDKTHEKWVLEYNNDNPLYRFLPGVPYPKSRFSAPVTANRKALEN